MTSLSVNDSGTWRAVRKTYVNDSGTWRFIKYIYVNDGGTWRKVFNGQHDFSCTFTSFFNGGDGTTHYVLNTITNGTLPDSTSIVTLEYIDTTFNQSRLSISGFLSSPGIGYGSTLKVANLVSLSSGSYSYSSGTASWVFSGDPFGIVASGSSSVSCIFTY